MSQEKNSVATAPKQEHPIRSFISRVERLEKDSREEEWGAGASDPKEILKYDIVPLMLQFAKLWHEHGTWAATQMKNSHDFLVQMSGRVDAIQADLVSLAGVVEEIRNNQPEDDGGVEYTTQFTAEDAESFDRFIKAAMALISSMPGGDAEAKKAILERGAELLAVVAENTLQPAEEEEDEDDDNDES